MPIDKNFRSKFQRRKIEFQNIVAVSEKSKYSKYIVGTYTFFSRSDISFCKTPRTIRSANQISFQEALHVIGMFANPVNTSSFRFFKVSIHPIANHLQSVCCQSILAEDEVVAVKKEKRRGGWGSCLRVLNFDAQGRTIGFLKIIKSRSSSNNNNNSSSRSHRFKITTKI